MLTFLFSALTWITATNTPPNVYNFQVTDIDGKPIKMESFKGKVLLIVNTASQCGFTKQYEGLQKLHEKYQDQGFAVLGFPANNFGGQEPGSNEEIKMFCKGNYNVSFPLFSKLEVKGDNQAPLFAYLTDQAGGGILWNFEKFLIDREGKFVERFRSITKPSSSKLQKKIESLLVVKPKT